MKTRAFPSMASASAASAIEVDGRGQPKEEREHCEREEQTKPNHDPKLSESKSNQVQGIQDHIDDLDADEGGNEAAQAVDQQVPPQQRRRADCPIGDAPERERN